MYNRIKGRSRRSLRKSIQRDKKLIYKRTKRKASKKLSKKRKKNRKRKKLSKKRKKKNMRGGDWTAAQSITLTHDGNEKKLQGCSPQTPRGQRYYAIEEKCDPEDDPEVFMMHDKSEGYHHWWNINIDGVYYKFDFSGTKFPENCTADATYSDKKVHFTIKDTIKEE